MALQPKFFDHIPSSNETTATVPRFIDQNHAGSLSQAVNPHPKVVLKDMINVSSIALENTARKLLKRIEKRFNLKAPKPATSPSESSSVDQA